LAKLGLAARRAGNNWEPIKNMRKLRIPHFKDIGNLGEYF
jgi:hypothetical protein